MLSWKRENPTLPVTDDDVQTDVTNFWNKVPTEF